MQTDTFQKAKIGLMALCLVLGTVLLLLAFRSPSTQTFTVPSYSMSVLGAVQPAPVARSVEVQDTAPILAVDGISRFSAGTQRAVAASGTTPDCKAEGMHTWTHEDASGNITFYCKP